MSAVELTTLILNLPQADKAELMGALMDALDGADPHDNDRDSLEEAIARSKELDDGTVTAMSEEEFWAAIKADRGR